MNLDTIICFIDADTKLDSNYLNYINRSQLKNSWKCAVVDFKHLNDEDKTRVLISDYEFFLKDTALRLKEANSPYGFVPIGCSMVCNLFAYIGVGGMNVRKAAEDFYFLQEMQKCYGVYFIDKILVYPSSRYINRSYLGTSKRMYDSLNDDFKISSLHYSSDSFRALASFLKLALSNQGNNIDSIMNESKKINNSLYKFLLKTNFRKAWPSISSSKDKIQFENQFHKWFDFLKTIKLLKYI